MKKRENMQETETGMQTPITDRIAYMAEQMAALIGTLPEGTARDQALISLKACILWCHAA